MMMAAAPCAVLQPQLQGRLQWSQSTEELHRSQVNMQSLHARVSQLEKLSRDAAEVQTRHEHWWKATHGQMEKVQAQLSQQDHRGEALKGNLEGLIAKCKGQLSPQNLSLKERVDYLDLLVNQSSRDVSQEVEALRVSHTKLASEVQEEEERRTRLEKRLSDSDKSFRALGEDTLAAQTRAAEQEQHLSRVDARLDAMAVDQASSSQDMNVTLEQSREVFRGLLQGEQRAREAQETSLREELAKADAIREQAVASLQLRVEGVRTRTSQLERVSRESGEIQTQHEQHFWKVMHGQLETVEARMAQQEDAQRAFLEERLGELDRALRELVARHESVQGKGQALQDEHLSGVDERLDAMVLDQASGLQAINAKVEQLRETLHGQLRVEQQAREAQSISIREELAKVEAIRDQAVAALQVRLDGVRKVLGIAPDRQAWLPGDSKVVPTSVLDRIQAVEHSVAEAAQELSRHDELKDEGDRRHDELAAASYAAIEDLRRSHGEVSSMQTALQERHLSLLERLEGLEQSGDSSARVSSQELARHKTALDETADRLREVSGVHVSVAALAERLAKIEATIERVEAAHVQALQSGLGHLEGRMAETLKLREQEEAQRSEQQQQAVREQLAAESCLRDALEKAVQFHLTREQRARSELEERCDSTKQDLRVAHDTLAEALSEERVARGRFQEATQEQLLREQSSRRSLEDLLVQEKSERFRQHERLHERLDAAERLRGSSPLRRELQSRLSRANVMTQSAQSLQRPGGAAIGETSGAASSATGESPERRSQQEAQVTGSKSLTSLASSDAILGRFILNNRADRDKTHVDDHLALQAGFGRRPPPLR